jgi:Fe(3+) dicitrate transport protein
MFNEGLNDFAQLAPNDHLQVQRANFSVVHQYKISKNTKIKNLLYGQQVSRNWRRQDFTYNNKDNDKPGNWTGQTWGDDEVLNGAIYMRNGTGQRNRNFDVFGAESRITHDYRFFGLKHQLSGGLRYLYERAYENRINGTKPDAISGALISYEERPGNAVSTFLQQQSSVGNTFHFHYGLRLESFNQTREIFRGNYNGKITDTAIVNSNLVQQLIPGGGLTYVLSEKLIVFSSAHRGFAPPRTKDAIDNEGGSYELAAELSNNIELGIRGKILKGIQFEVTGFRMDFVNQIIPISESSGGSCTGLINAGASVHQGIEGAITIQSSDFFNWKKWFVTTNTNVTHVDARFKGERLVNNIAIENLRTPYAPQWITNSMIQLQHIEGIGLRISHQYVSSQFTDIPNTIAPSNNGREGIMPAYELWDLNTFYDWKSKNWRFNFTVKNLTNERYIATRRPQGIRVGLPRTFIVGLEKTF